MQYLNLFEKLLERVVVLAAELLKVDKVHLALWVTLRAHVPVHHQNIADMNYIFPSIFYQRSLLYYLRFTTVYTNCKLHTGTIDK
jgi:hypothetical protein